MKNSEPTPKILYVQDLGDGEFATWTDIEDVKEDFENSDNATEIYLVYEFKKSIKLEVGDVKITDITKSKDKN